MIQNAFLRHMLFMPALDQEDSPEMPVDKLLQKEAAAINHMLSGPGGRDIQAAVTRAYVARSGNFVQYVFDAADEKARDDLAKIKPERWEALIAEHRSNPRKVAASFNPITLRLETPYPGEQLPLPWSQATIAASGNSQVFLGREYVGSQKMPLVLDLTDSNTPHLLIVATTGGGKTVLLKSILFSATAAASPDKLGIVLLDPKGALPDVDDVPHIHRTRDPEQATDVLHAVVKELEARAAGASRYRRIIVAIDELYDLLQVNPEIEYYCKRINQIGRELNIHLIGCTQHATAEALGSVMRANFPARCIGRVMDSTASKVAAGRSGVGAESLPGKGAFYLVESGTVTRFQTHLISDKDTSHHIQMLKEKYGAEKVKILPDIEPQKEEIDTQVEKILNEWSIEEILKPDADPSQPLNKRLKRGKQKEVRELLFGPNANPGLSHKVLAAIEAAINVENAGI